MSDEKNTTPAPQQVSLIRICNPFDPRDHVRETLDWAPNKTIRDYFPIGMASLVLSVNGKIIPLDEFDTTYLSPEDNVVVCPVPHGGGGGGGGGGGKQVLQLVAIIAVAWFAPTIAMSLGASMGITAGTLGMTMLRVGVQMAGSLLVNALMAPAQSPNNPGSNSNSSDLGSSSPTYGIDGAKNTTAEGVPVPVLYGEYRIGGNMVDMYVENDGDTQQLYMRIVASEGPINYIGDLQLNNQPITNFSGVETDIRLGTSSQTVMGWFNDIYTPINKGLKLTTSWLYHNTNEVDKIRSDFVAQSGLFHANNEGGLETVTVGIQIQYRPAGTSTWLDMPTSASHLGNRAGRKVSGTWRWMEGNAYGSSASYASEASGAVVADAVAIKYLEENKYVDVASGETRSKAPVYSTGASMSDARRAAVRKSFMSPILPRGEYELRYRRTSEGATDLNTSDQVFLSDVNEINTQDLAIPYTAMLGLKIKLSEQLNGVPTVTFKARGMSVRVNRLPKNGSEPAGRNWYTEFSDNPAWIVWDILTNTRYGGAMAESRLDLSAFQRFADFCEAKGLTWNGPIDSSMNVWDAAQLVLRVGHAQLVGVGTRFTVITESEADPVMMFSVANMIKDSFKETWLPISDRATEIDITYFDKEDDYKQRTIKVYDQTALTSGRPTRNASITLYGVVDAARAYKEGVFQLNLNRHILQTVDFSAPLEAIACSVGDLVYVQHDMPEWGFAGRTEVGSTTSVVQLDREVNMTTGSNYKLMLIYDTIQRNTGTITSIVGNSVFLSGLTDDSLRIKRIKTPAIERNVDDIFQQGIGSYGVVVDNPAGLTVGATYTLYDTDVIEERSVVTTAGNFTAVTVQSPLPSAPGAFIHWMFGEVNKVKKPFRIKAITGTHEYKRDITAIEYNASVYDIDGTVVPTMNYSSNSSAISHVTIDGIDESLVPFGNSFKTDVTIYFSSAQNSYARSTVYVSTNGGPYQTLSTSALDRATLTGAEEGSVLKFKVVARDVVGSTALDATAPTYTHTVLGKTAPPSDVGSLTIEVANNNLLLTWPKVGDVDLLGYEIRKGSSWDTAQALVTNYAGTSYLATINEAGVHDFLIRAVDTGGRYSSNPTLGTITILAPSPVMGFDCVQNGERIEFRWNANTEKFLRGYELREGDTWQTASLLTRVSATTYSTPANSNAGNRKFWIKAIVEPGVESAIGTFTVTNVAAPSDRNIVLHKDEYADGWTGSKYQVTVTDGYLQLDEGKNYGEYTWNVALPKSYRARTSIDSAFSAVSIDDTPWTASTWNWVSTQAARLWSPTGDISTVDLQYFISKFVGLDASYLEGFSMNSTTTGANGTAAAEAVGVTYGAGRFLNGAHMGHFTRLSWDLSIPAEFNTTLWAIPSSTPTGNQVYWVGQTAGGLRLICGYDATLAQFYLEDTLGQKITVPYTVETSDRVLIGIVQTATTRKLHIGALARTPASASGAFTPLGSLTRLQLQQ